MLDVSRRMMLAGAAALAAAPASGQTAPAARVKGPLVWMNMDQKELDDAYDQAVYAPNRDIVINRCKRNSALARERLGAPKRFTYCPTKF
jgi:arylformamidase